jgi:5-methylcytosine-specific restriction protein A
LGERIRGRRLQGIRAHWFRAHPLCVMCEKAGRVRMATQLDHIVALDNGGKDFDRDHGRNRQGLCEDCHRTKTAADLGHKVKGCDVTGRPLDPRHHWNT